MSGLVSAHDLPPEILSNVFGFLTGPAPSEVFLHEQPSGDMLDVATHYTDTGHHTEQNSRGRLSVDLKSISCTNKKWRAVVLPHLFCNVLWRPQVSTLDVFNLQPIPLLQFLLDNRLNHYVTTFTLIVDFAEDATPTQVADRIRPTDLEWLWDQLLSVVDPLRFTIIAPPATLAALLNRMLFLGDAWSFNIPYHILSLARSSRTAKMERPLEDEAKTAKTSEVSSSQISSSVGGQSNAATRPTARTTPDSSGSSCNKKVAPPCPLFTLRSWTSILLNEGSSIRAYQTYEYFQRLPPSMLDALLGTGEYPNNQPLIPSSIIDLNYIAIFPFSSHVQTLFANLPKIDRLFIQLTPRPGNMILQDREVTRRIDMSDLWMERNSAYGHLFSELTQHIPQENWASLQVFESGDAADKESWEEAVSFLNGTGINAWVPEREGVLVKVDVDGNPARPNDIAGQHLLGDDELMDRTLLSVYLQYFDVSPVTPLL